MLETDNRKFAIYCQNMWGVILSNMKYFYIGLLSSSVKCHCNRCRGTRVNEQVASRTLWLNLIPKGPYTFVRMRFQQFTVNVFVSFWHLHINGLVKYCSISISNPLEYWNLALSSWYELICIINLFWTNQSFVLRCHVLWQWPYCEREVFTKMIQPTEENWFKCIRYHQQSNVILQNINYLYMEPLVHKVPTRVCQRRGHGMGGCVLPYSLGSVRYHQQSPPMFCQVSGDTNFSWTKCCPMLPFK